MGERDVCEAAARTDRLGGEVIAELPRLVLECLDSPVVELLGDVDGIGRGGVHVCTGSRRDVEGSLGLWFGPIEADSTDHLPWPGRGVRPHLRLGTKCIEKVLSVHTRRPAPTCKGDVSDGTGVQRRCERWYWRACTVAAAAEARQQLEARGGGN